MTKKMTKLLLGILLSFTYTGIVLLQFHEIASIVSIVILFIIQIIFLPIIMKELISVTAMEKGNIKYFYSIGINFIFMNFSSLFIISDKYKEYIWYQIITFIILMIVILRICFLFKREKSKKENINDYKNYDFEYLKFFNRLMVAVFTAVIYILKINNYENIFSLENLLSFYFVIPYTLSQGLYVILSKKLIDDK